MSILRSFCIEDFCMKKTVFLGAALVAASMGCDELKTEDPVDEKFRGEWQFAKLASGETNPTDIGCELHNLLHSRKRFLIVEKDKITTKYLYYVANGNCDSSSTFTLETSVNLTDTDTKDDKAIFESRSFSLKAELSNAATALYFSTNNICDNSSWQTILAYYTSDDTIKACTAENGGGFLTALPSDDEVRNTLVRLQSQGNGIAYGTKTKDQADEEFANGQLYFIKK